MLLKKLLNMVERLFGAQDRNRTGTRGLASTDFKSVVSTYFTTRACNYFTLFKTLRERYKFTILQNTTKKPPLGWLSLFLEARAGVEPTYTDLQSGA